MRRRTRHRLLGLVALAVLLVVTAWQYLGDRAREPGTLLPLTPAAVTRIDVERAGHPAHHYVRRRGHWQAADGGHVDAGRMDELAALAAVPVIAWRHGAEFDPARIGLAPPALTVTLNGHALQFGALSAVAPQRYVRVGRRIALIAAADSPRAALRNVIRKQL